MTPYRLKIVAPDKIFFDGETEQIIVRTTEGDVGILANHTSYVANLPAGPLRVKLDGAFKYAAISGGVIKVSKDLVTILAVSIEWGSDIDVARAKLAEEKAREVLAEKSEGREFDKASFELKRALNRLSVAEK